MTGEHRRTSVKPFWSAWTRSTLLALLVTVGVLAYLAIVIYVLVGGQRWSSLLIAGNLALATVVWAGRLAGEVLRDRTRSPASVAEWIGDAVMVIGLALTLVADIGDRERWLHGSAEFALRSATGVILAAWPVYFLVGQRRMEGVLTARLVGGRWPWSARDASTT
jgi:hypothetical protein